MRSAIQCTFIGCFQPYGLIIVTESEKNVSILPITVFAIKRNNMPIEANLPQYQGFDYTWDFITRCFDSQESQVFLC